TGLQTVTYSGSLRETLPQYWQTYDQLVFALATGAVVRLIAPLLNHKATDPAVVVVDEAGQFAISLCGGHQGGADRLAQQVAQYLGGTPILTGAANHRNLSGIDVVGEPFGWVKGGGDWTGVSSAIAAGQAVQVVQEAGSDLWQQHLPPDHPFQWGWPEVSGAAVLPKPQARVWISPIQRQFSPGADLPKVQWHPRVLWVGLGCERGTDLALMELALSQVCQAHHLAKAAIAGIASLDLKADEVGLVQLCQDHGWPLRCFSAEELQAILVPNPSSVVNQAVGTPSVAEAAAITAASTTNPASLRVQKQVIRHPDYAGAVTLAIAEAEQEYTGRNGHLWLVGTGPGNLDQMTPAAKAAITGADAVVGYRLYMDLIRPLLRPGQIIEAMPITQEQQRAERAIELARWGLSVAVISSGDCGIYAMAGLVLETLQAQGWEGHSPTVEGVPGISALQSAAARVGAPLMHDFCAISLSDLLTPWAVIEQRLRAAAEADFVVALYNPKSQQRTEQIAIAQGIFAQHRPANTPVALVRAAYRPDERIIVTTVQAMLDHPIDMLTTVLIGNRSTQLYAGKVITPRGYRVN
ncbi:MAG: precorrin-3B C(17)-methyltransferase, partial [Cyanobacteria bacterium]|nr:precorrin-3B C(17)-methyltransferase [Cyanobacteriota bacterium]